MTYSRLELRAIEEAVLGKSIEALNALRDGQDEATVYRGASLDIEDMPSLALTLGEALDILKEARYP